MLDRNRTAQHPAVSRDAWIDARLRLLKKEKELTRLHDDISAARRELPWQKVEKNYVFDTTEGRKSLAELFDGRSQLLVYHFMWRFDLDQGCVGCSFLCDHIDGANLHLAHHDVTLIAVSRGPLENLEAYRRRMGWTFKFASSFGSDFNHDYHVSFTEEDLARGEVYYNYAMIDPGIGELPGLSVFVKSDNGEVFHTYSTYARGLDILIGAHNFLDLTPKGRDEVKTMDWVKRHDEYEGAEPAACCHAR
jgi:predicted dithiol-disulfide oxidoreductase (DUF899 family)